MRDRQEHVVPGVQVDALIQGRGCRTRTPSPACRRLRTARSASAAVRSGGSRDQSDAPVPPGPSRNCCPRRSTTAGASTSASRSSVLDRRGEGRGLVPEGARHEDARRSLAVRLVAENGRHRFAVADRLAPGRRSGWTPSPDQLASSDRRRPARTSSRISAAPSASQISRTRRAKATSGSSWS